MTDWINKCCSFICFSVYSFIFWGNMLKAGSVHIQNIPWCSLYGPLLSDRVFLSFFWLLLFFYIKGWNERLRVRSTFDLFLTLSWLLCDFKHVTWTSQWPQLWNGAAWCDRGIAKSSKSQSLSKQSHLRGSGACTETGGRLNFPSQRVSWTHTLNVCGNN